MIIYKDIITGDEIISDTYDLKDIDDTVYEVDCKMVTINSDPKIDVGDSNDAAKAFGGRGESSGGKEEDEKEDAAPKDAADEDEPPRVNNVIDAFRLNQIPPYSSKEDFIKSLKIYLKNLSNKLKENGADESKIKSINDGIKKYSVRKMAPKIKDFDPYLGESFNTEEGMPVYLNFRDDGETPYFTIWKHGLIEMKV